MNLAYVAGIMDGEGSIGFAKTRGYATPRVLVTNTNISLLQDLAGCFGGNINPLSKRKQGWKKAYSWRITSARAVNFIEKIYPYLRIKDRQAQVVFAWDAIRPGSGRQNAANKAEHDDAVALILEQISWLNKRGQNDSESPMALVAAEIGKGRSKKK